MKNIIASFILSLTLSWTVQAQETYVDSITGITVSFVTDDHMFPESWLGGSVNGRASSLDEAEYARSKRILSKSLAKYPLWILKKNLKKIYILHDLNFYGVNYGGTNSTDAVYLTNQGVEKNYTDLYLEQIFHEEFSSILLRNYASYIDETAWMECASDSITYGGTGADAIRNGKAGEHFDARINENGFLGEYATSNFENDINSFAKNIFCPKPDFWKLMKDYPRLQCKLNMIIKFYHKIDKEFTKEFFKLMEE